jgi:hypothetical protein
MHVFIDLTDNAGMWFEDEFWDEDYDTAYQAAKSTY